MEFDNLHALENYLDIYDNPGEAVVTEAIANSVDADSSRVDIKFGLDPNGKRIISFQDDGPGMNEKQFADRRQVTDTRFGAAVGIRRIVAARDSFAISLWMSATTFSTSSLPTPYCANLAGNTTLTSHS